MIKENIAVASLLLFAAHVMAAEPVLPKQMEGKWGQRQNKAEVELIQMETPTTAKLKVVLWDGCTRRGETTAEFKDGSWEFVAPGGVKCDDVKVKITQLEGKNRFEGTTQTARGNSTVYLEW